MNARELGQQVVLLIGIQVAQISGEQGLLTRKAHELVAVGVLVGRGCGHVMVGIKAFWQ